MHRAVERAHVAGQGDAVEREQDVARLRAPATIESMPDVAD